jgi:hypothetical protein
MKAKNLRFIILAIVLVLPLLIYKMTRIYYVDPVGIDYDVTDYVKSGEYYLFKDPQVSGLQDMIRATPYPFPMNEFRKIIAEGKVEISNKELLSKIIENNSAWIAQIGYISSSPGMYGLRHFFLGKYSLSGRPVYLTTLYDEKNKLFDIVEISETSRGEYESGPAAAYQSFLRQAREQAQGEHGLLAR